MPCRATLCLVECCFTSTETVGVLGTGAQDGHLDFHTTPELCVTWLKCCFTSTETVGLLGTGAQDGHLDFHTAPELCHTLRRQCWTCQLNHTVCPCSEVSALSHLFQRGPSRAGRTETSVLVNYANLHRNPKHMKG